MKYIKYFKENLGELNYSELKEEIELYIVDLIDKEFSVDCEIENNKTYDHIEVTIISPYDPYKPYDEQEKHYWNEMKDSIIVLINILNSKFNISQVSISLCDGGLYIIDNKDFNDLDKDLSKFSNDPDHNIDSVEVSSIMLSLIKNK